MATISSLTNVYQEVISITVINITNTLHIIAALRNHSHTTLLTIVNPIVPVTGNVRRCIYIGKKKRKKEERTWKKGEGRKEEMGKGG